MFLLDTVVISELRKAQRNPRLVAWLQDKKDTDLFLSVLTIGEIRRGICKQEAKDPHFAERLAIWLDSLLQFYRERLLPISSSIALEWGNINALVGNSNADNLIAATAKVHHLTVITRNTKHFEDTGIPCLNPWS